MKTDENRPLGILTRVLIGDIKECSVFHIISWLSHKSRTIVKSGPASEILAAAEGTDDTKDDFGSDLGIFKIKISHRLFVDSKDIFTSLSTQRISKY